MHLVAGEVDKEKRLAEQRGAHALKPGQQRGPVVFGLVEQVLHRVDVSHAALQLAEVPVQRVPTRNVQSIFKQATATCGGILSAAHIWVDYTARSTRNFDSVFRITWTGLFAIF